jgi:hypothetical protein
MNPDSQKVCFGTLAFGQNYRALAGLLAADLAQYAPGIPLIILTDRPQDFRGMANLIIFPHRQRLFCDNDKVFLIKQALSTFNTCICIDADMRVLAPIPADLQWLPGITARSGDRLVKHHQRIITKTNPPRPNKVKDWEMTKRIADKLGLNAEDEAVKFIHEFLFVVTRNSGVENEFLDYFEKIAYFLEINGTQPGAGTAMGLAAAKAGLPVKWDEMEKIVFFDDRIERVRISKGQVDPQEKQIYFEQQKALKYPLKNWYQKVVGKVNGKWRDFNRSLLLRMVGLKNFDFYYR